jgi:hypothetical protein
VSTLFITSSRAGLESDRSVCAAGSAARPKRGRVVSGFRQGLIGCCFAALALVGSHSLADPVSAGTKLEIRLQQPISSYATHKGARISGVLIAPVTEGGDMLLPLGTTVEGSVLSVRKVGIGVVHETARIQLQFDRVRCSVALRRWRMPANPWMRRAVSRESVPPPL